MGLLLLLLLLLLFSNLVGPAAPDLDAITPLPGENGCDARLIKPLTSQPGHLSSPQVEERSAASSGRNLEKKKKKVLMKCGQTGD